MTRAALILLSLIAASGLRAEEPEPAAVAPADRTAISGCLADAGPSQRSCIGTIAVVCARQAAGERREAEVTCSRREAEVWRERLDAAGRIVSDRLEAGARARFVALQRSWEAYTAQKCSFVFDVQDAARAPGAQAGCELNEVALRAIEVERLARRQTPNVRGDGRPRIER